jgi:hypothetical protein
MKPSSKSTRVAVPAAPIHTADPNERMNRLAFLFFMSMVGLGVLVALGMLLFA